MMGSLQDKLKDQLNQCEMEESNRVGAFNMVSQSLVNEIAQNKDALGRRVETKKAR